MMFECIFVCRCKRQAKEGSSRVMEKEGGKGDNANGRSKRSKRDQRVAEAVEQPDKTNIRTGLL